MDQYIETLNQISETTKALAQQIIKNKHKVHAEYPVSIMELHTILMKLNKMGVTIQKESLICSGLSV